MEHHEKCIVMTILKDPVINSDIKLIWNNSHYTFHSDCLSERREWIDPKKMDNVLIQALDSVQVASQF